MCSPQQRTNIDSCDGICRYLSDLQLQLKMREAYTHFCYKVEEEMFLKPTNEGLNVRGLVRAWRQNMKSSGYKLS